MKWEQILYYLITALSGGGIVAIVQTIANKDKTKADVNAINTKTAIELQEIAINGYKEMYERLNTIQKLLDSTRFELDSWKKYSEALESLLRQNDIEIPTHKLPKVI